MSRKLASIAAGILALGLTGLPSPASADARMAGGLAGPAPASPSVDTIGYYYRGYGGPHYRSYGYGPYYGYGGYGRGYGYGHYGYGGYGYRTYRPYYGGYYGHYRRHYPHYRRFRTESDG